MAFRTFEHSTFSPEISRRSLFRGGAYMAAGTALASLPFGRQLLAHDVSESWPRVSALAQKYLSEKKVANLFLTFGWGQDDMAHTVGGGNLSLAGETPVDMDSLYRIYSMTKPVTGICAMALIDDGLIGLDQPVYDILPAFREMMVQVEYDGAITEDNLEPAKSPITIRQLMTHTAGLGYGIIQKGPIMEAYNEAGLIPGQVSRLPIPGLFRGPSVDSLEKFADGIASMPLVYQPGTMWSYSVGLDILGRVIEVADGKPFEQVLQDRVFGPCGMTSTFFKVPEGEIGRLTDNYGVLGGVPVPIDPAESSIYLDTPPFPTGGAGLVSSPRDYDRFMRMLLGNGKIGNTRALPELAIRVGTTDLLPKTAVTEGTWSQGQGFGAGGRVVDGTFGWGGAAGTLAAVSYKLGLRTGLYTQYMPTEAYPMRDEYLAALEADMAAMQGS